MEFAADRGKFLYEVLDMPTDELTMWYAYYQIQKDEEIMKELGRRADKGLDEKVKKYGG